MLEVWLEEVFLASMCVWGGGYLPGGGGVRGLGVGYLPGGGGVRGLVVGGGILTRGRWC